MGKRRNREFQVPIETKKKQHPKKDLQPNPIVLKKKIDFGMLPNRGKMSAQ